MGFLPARQDLLIAGTVMLMTLGFRYPAYKLPDLFKAPVLLTVNMFGNFADQIAVLVIAAAFLAVFVLFYFADQRGRHCIAGLTMTVPLTFRQITYEHFLKAFIAVLVCLYPALCLCFHGDRREHEGVGCHKDNNGRNRAHKSRKDAARFAVS